MKVMSPTLVTVAVPPRNGVWNAPGADGSATWTADSFQNGLFVCNTGTIPAVLLRTVKVNGRPAGEVAVTGKINDRPAGMVTSATGSIAGAGKTELASKMTASQTTTILQQRIPGNHCRQSAGWQMIYFNNPVTRRRPEGHSR